MINYKEEIKNNSIRIFLEGDLISGSFDEIREHLKQIINNGIISITMDMSKIAAVDSSGIGFLASVYNTLKKNGGVFSVVELSRDIYTFFVSLRLNTHFIVEQIREE